MSYNYRLALKLTLPLTLAGAMTLILLAALPEQSGAAEIDSTVQQTIEATAQRQAPTEPAAPVTKLAVNSKIDSLENRSAAVQFYRQFSGSEGIAKTIMDRAIELELPVHIAFALAWRESRFDPKAVSPRNRGGTRDWGLFQLNDGGRRDWSADDFFDIDKNTHSALYYLRQCIAGMGSLELGLAAYNAGVYGVRTRGLSATTRNYAIVHLGRCQFTHINWISQAKMAQESIFDKRL